jgi:hypothetical protein
MGKGREGKGERRGGKTRAKGGGEEKRDCGFLKDAAHYAQRL